MKTGSETEATEKESESVSSGTLQSTSTRSILKKTDTKKEKSKTSSK